MSENINIIDPAQVREWEERIARFEGWHQRPSTLGPPYWCDPSGVPHFDNDLPNYSRSLPDLHRVLDRFESFNLMKEGANYALYINQNFPGAWFETPEQAMFYAVCAYLEMRSLREVVEPQGSDRQD